MKILTPNFVSRLARANESIRALRGAGYRVLACTVPPGDYLGKSEIVVADGNAMNTAVFTGCNVRREVGGAGK